MINLKVISKWEKEKVREYTQMKIINIKVIGKMVKWMGMVFLHGMIIENMRDNSKIINLKVMVFIPIEMEKFMMECLDKVKNMEMDRLVF